MARGRGFSWPDAGQELLLKAALCDRGEALAAWQSWQASHDLESIDTGSFRLIPLVFRRLERWGSSHAALPQMRGIYRQSWTRNAFLHRQLGPTLKRLHEAGIPALLLKGIALARLAYRDDGARPMKDADLLVAPRHFDTAVKITVETGWSPKPLETHLLWPEARHFTGPTRHDLDLHHHLFPWDSLDDVDAALWAAAVPLEVDAVPCLALCPADQLLHVLVHGIAWNPEPQVRWAADAATTIAAAGPALDWDRLLDQARARSLLAPVRAGLTYLHDAFAVVVPSHVVRALAAARIAAADRLDLAVRRRRQDGMLGALPTLWFDYRRGRRAAGRSAGAGGFVRALREALAPPGSGSLAAILARKALRRLGVARRSSG